MPSSPPPESRCCTTTVTRERASSSPTPSCSGSRTGWWWRIAAWRPADSSTASGARARAPSSPRTARSSSCAHASGLEAATPAARVRPLLAVALAAALGVGVPRATRADGQRDPQLQSVVAKAIAEAQCFTDQYDSAVWYTLMEPRLRRIIREKDERLDILKQVYCETHRPGEARLPPGLVMALIDVESRFDRWAVSPAGAVGLMQVMPFWPERLGAWQLRLTRLLRAGVLRAGVYRQHARHALTARVGRPLIAAVGEAHHAVQAGVLRMAAFQLDATLVQPGEQRGRELRDLTAEGVAACDEVRQLDRLFEGQLPGE